MDKVLDIPEGYDFGTRRRSSVEGGVLAPRLSAFLPLLPERKRQQFREIMAVSGFTDDENSRDVLLSPTVITRVYFMQTLTEFVEASNG